MRSCIPTGFALNIINRSATYITSLHDSSRNPVKKLSNALGHEILMVRQR